MAQIVTQSQETCGMQMLHIHFNNWPVTCGKSCRHVSAAVRVRLYSRGFRIWAEAVVQHEYLRLSPFVLSIFSMHDSGVKVENRQPATPAGRWACFTGSMKHRQKTRRVLSEEERSSRLHWPGSNSSSEERDYEVRGSSTSSAAIAKKTSLDIPEGVNLVSMLSCFRPIKRHFIITRQGLLNLNLLKCTTEIPLQRVLRAALFWKSKARTSPQTASWRCYMGQLAPRLRGSHVFHL